MKAKKTLQLLSGILMLISCFMAAPRASAQNPPLGSHTGTDADAYIINNNHSPNATFVRLHSFYNGADQAWNILNQDESLKWSYSTSDGHSDMGTERMRLTKDGVLRIQTDYGYTDIGAKNEYWSHFETSAPRYFFDKGITVFGGQLGSYNGDLELQTTGNTRITVLNASGNVGIGTATPHNPGGWDKVLDVHGGPHAKIMVTTDDSEVKTGIYSHSNWYPSLGAMGVVGTQSNHDFRLMAHGTHHVTLKTDGNVGIGTTSPGEKLTVYDGELALQTNDNTENQGLLFQNSGGYYTWRMYRSDAGSSYAHLKFATGLNTDFTQLTDVMIIKNNGDVGIGTNSPAEKLEVNGTVKADSFTSSAASFPDYVFAADYKITPLAELETYVKANKHLPNMPSEKEVVEKGLNLPEVVTKSVENIETIYLYLIRMEKEIEALKQENATLKQQLEKGR